MKTTGTAVACTVLFSMAAGCAAPEVRKIDGATGRTGPEAAILFTAREDAYPDKRPRAFFSAVDGTHSSTYIEGHPAVARVAPGEALINVSCFDTPPAKWETSLLFRAALEAGHYYELACDHFSASAIDRGTDYESIRQLLPSAIEDKLAR